MLFFATAFCSLCSAAELRKVALSGELVPGNSGVFAGFGVPVLNDAGQVAFVGTRIVNGFGTFNGIWSEGNGSMALVAEAGSLAPGTTQNFLSFQRLALNDAGQTHFCGSTADGIGIWSEGNGPLSLVAIEGHAAPNTSGVFWSVANGFPIPVFNDTGQTTIIGTVITPGIPDNQQGIWATKSGTLALVALAGDAAPTNSPGEFFANPFSNPVINSEGHLAFLGGLTGPPEVGGNFGTAVWLEADGILTEVARTGVSIPGTTHTVLGFDNPVINDLGRTAFRGHLNGNAGWGVWSEGSGNLDLVARTGDEAPGTTASFSTLHLPVLSNTGETAFQGALFGPGVDQNNSSGIWAERDGSLALVARAGDIAPGTNAPFSYFTNENNPVINALGQVAFTARAGGADGIWAQDSSGVLSLIALEGDTIDVGNGGNPDLRTIAHLDFISNSLVMNSGNGDGRPSGLNDLGQLAFRAMFTDSTSGIFVSSEAAVNGDFNNSGMVDGADFLAWQRGESPIPLSISDLVIWENSYGSSTLLSAVSTTVPEPSSHVVILLGCFFAAIYWRT
ncbi:hypothetical protein HG15A2_26550 [Adhaeretor mobilis]|uniref:Uncharacterized protein n=2 Tax=Adhaeretor mobilis TaxID=1930276 RepID=A0A517MWT3_9BACT|nr:hypothetical protein HG15A2_26550 [Adhaeretor mobilis]